jgi:hypothetical protein
MGGETVRRGQHPTTARFSLNPGVKERRDDGTEVAPGSGEIGTVIVLRSCRRLPHASSSFVRGVRLRPQPGVSSTRRPMFRDRPPESGSGSAQPTGTPQKWSSVENFPRTVMQCSYSDLVCGVAAHESRCEFL